jgi:hypothetical protein
MPGRRLVRVLCILEGYPSAYSGSTSAPSRRSVRCRQRDVEGRCRNWPTEPSAGEAGPNDSFSIAASVKSNLTSFRFSPAFGSTLADSVPGGSCSKRGTRWRRMANLRAWGCEMADSRSPTARVHVFLAAILSSSQRYGPTALSLPVHRSYRAI